MAHVTFELAREKSPERARPRELTEPCLVAAEQLLSPQIKALTLGRIYSAAGADPTHRTPKHTKTSLYEPRRRLR